MKYLKLKFFLLSVFAMIASTSFTDNNMMMAKEKEEIVELPFKGLEKLNLTYIEPVLIEIPEVDQNQMFLDAIGFKESGNRYDIVNKFGYMGRYQFGRGTLKGLGYKVTQEEFLTSPEIQERAMMDLLRHNKKKLQKYIDQYEGEVVHGILITESGILAAAHLGGQGNVKKFFRRGKEFKDGFGTSITSYMEMFGGYRIEI
jgi:hypothetical protein